jgi:hypothetical protein
MIKNKQGYGTDTLHYDCLYCGNSFDKEFITKSGQGGVPYTISKTVVCNKCKNGLPYEDGK